MSCDVVHSTTMQPAINSRTRQWQKQLFMMRGIDVANYGAPGRVLPRAVEVGFKKLGF